VFIVENTFFFGFRLLRPDTKIGTRNDFFTLQHSTGIFDKKPGFPLARE
jgi:hypothetical protein